MWLGGVIGADNAEALPAIALICIWQEWSWARIVNSLFLALPEGVTLT